MYNQPIPRLESHSQVDEDEARRRRGVLTNLSLHDENVRYAGTLGISQNNRSAHFSPAYLDRDSGEWVLSRFGDGTLAPIHVLDGLPSNWIAARDAGGHVTRTRPGIVSGFVRDGMFYSRDEASLLITH